MFGSRRNYADDIARILSRQGNDDRKEKVEDQSPQDGQSQKGKSQSS